MKRFVQLAIVLMLSLSSVAVAQVQVSNGVLIVGGQGGGSSGVTQLNGAAGAVTLIPGPLGLITISTNTAAKTITIDGAGAGLGANTFTGTQTMPNLIDTGLGAAGNCITTNSAGMLISTGAPCGGGGGGGVTSLNSLIGAVTLAAGANITLTPSGNTISIAATTSGGSGCTGGCVTSINGLQNAVTAVSTSPGLTITPSGSNLNFALTGVGSASGVVGYGESSIPVYPTAYATSFSITSNVVTIVANNGFVVGQQVQATGFSTGTYLNGVPLTILSQSPTSFTASFTHANVTSTTDASPLQTNQIQPHPTMFALTPQMSLSQINSLIAQYNVGGGQQPVGGTATIVVPDGVQQQPWTNQTSTTGSGNFGISFNDIRQGARTTTLSTWGVACNARTVGVQLINGSTVATPSFAQALSTDVGYTLVVTGVVGGIPTRFMPTITASSGLWTLSTPSPMTGTFTAKLGTLNTTNFQNAMFGLSASPGLVGQVPAGCAIMTGPVIWNAGQSLVGESASGSQVWGLPGEDIFRTPDASGQGSVTKGGLKFGDLLLSVDNSIDATQPWQAIDATGTTTARPALYRPVAVGGGPTGVEPANNPLAPGWALNATNGVASITNGQTVICVPNALGRMPAISQIIFPYTSTVFKTTVTSLTGAGCASGFSPATMAAPAPATVAQAVWISTTSIQNLLVAIPAGAVSYPTAFTVTNSIALIPGYEGNVATHGWFKVGSEEYGYTGVANAAGGPYTLHVTSGPATSSGWAVGSAVVPLNPCSAERNTPYPVVPTVNSNAPTPTGAVYFPGMCVGNSAIAMPQNDAAAFIGTGFSGASIQNVIVTPTTSISGASYINNTGCYYMAGNMASYATGYDGIQCNGTEFDIVQGPAAHNQHYVGPVGPTSEGNYYRNLTLRGTYNLFLTDIQNSVIQRCDAYTTQINQIDGTVVGPSTAFMLTPTFSEQTGSQITFPYQITMNDCNSEPETSFATFIERPIYAEIDSTEGHFTNNNFEGVPTFIGGQFNIFDGGQLSTPSFNYGQGNSIKDTVQTSYGSMQIGSQTNTVTNWGQELTESVPVGIGQVGPRLWGTNNVRASSDGQTDQFAYFGNFAQPPVDTKGGMIYPDEFVTNRSVESNPMTTVGVFDPTALVSGEYASCVFTAGSSCNTSHFDGSALLAIGPQNRIPADQTLLSMLVRSPAGASSVSVRIGINNGGGCTGGTTSLVTQSFPTTTGWTPAEMAVNLTGLTGCTLNINLPYNGNLGEFDFQYFDFLPLPSRVLLRTQTLTAGNPCTAPGILGVDATNMYLCPAGTVVALPLAGGGGGGITGGTGDTVFSGTGVVATTTGNINGGTPFKSQGVGPECNNGSAGQLNVCQNISLTGPIVGGAYTVPSSSTAVFDGSQGNTQILTLTSNTTSTFTGGTTGEDLNFEVFQNGTGGWTFAWPTNFFGFPPVQMVAGSYTTARGFYDGTNVVADGYNSTLCINGANPAVCGAAFKGFVAIPAGTNSTVVVNTTALSSSSVILVEGDEQVSIPGVTCGTSNPSGPINTVARNSGVSFTLLAPGTITGSYCLGWIIVNP